MCFRAINIWRAVVASDLLGFLENGNHPVAGRLLQLSSVSTNSNLQGIPLKFRGEYGLHPEVSIDRAQTLPLILIPFKLMPRAIPNETLGNCTKTTGTDIQKMTTFKEFTLEFTQFFGPMALAGISCVDPDADGRPSSAWTSWSLASALRCLRTWRSWEAPENPSKMAMPLITSISRQSRTCQCVH